MPSYVTFADERGTGGASTSRLSNAAVGAAASVTAVPNSLAAATAAAAIPAAVAPSSAAVTLAAECLIADGDDEVPLKQSTQQAESTQADEVQLDVHLEAAANEPGKGKKLKVGEPPAEMPSCRRPALLTNGHPTAGSCQAGRCSCTSSS